MARSSETPSAATQARARRRVASTGETLSRSYMDAWAELENARSELATMVAGAQAAKNFSALVGLLDKTSHKINSRRNLDGQLYVSDTHALLSARALHRIAIDANVHTEPITRGGYPFVDMVVDEATEAVNVAEDRVLATSTRSADHFQANQGAYFEIAVRAMESEGIPYNHGPGGPQAVGATAVAATVATPR